jgi:hypothetical protein
MRTTVKGKDVRIRNWYSVFFLLSGILVLGCSGGGGTTDPGLLLRTLSWEAPIKYTDGTNIDNLAADLKEYRIYVRQDNNFSPSDAYVTVPVVDPTTSQLVTQYDLRNAVPVLGLTAEKWYYVSMKTISTVGVESDFSAPSPPFKF